jgi:hypothetical protein
MTRILYEVTDSGPVEKRYQVWLPTEGPDAQSNPIVAEFDTEEEAQRFAAAQNALCDCDRTPYEHCYWIVDGLERCGNCGRRRT